MASRHAMTQRQALANLQDQMEFMSQLVEQYQFDPITLTVYLPDGSSSIRKFTRDDLVSEAGFDFIIEYDPTYGDDAVRRNHLMIFLDLALKYENFRIQKGDPKFPEANVSEIFRKLAQSFGWYDTSEILKPVNGQMDPIKEHELMAQGIAVQPNPSDNDLDHYQKHFLWRSSPELAKMIETGKIQPETLVLLDAHIEATRQQIIAKMQATQEIAQAEAIKQAQNQSIIGPAAGTGIKPLQGASR